MSKKRINVMLEEEQIQRLKTLSRLTRIKMSEFIREGVDFVLSKYYQKEYQKSLRTKKKVKKERI